MSDEERDDGQLYAACARRAMEARNPVERADCFLRYLEAFPLGRHNRRAAQFVEDLVHRLVGPEARALQQRLRRLRDPHMPRPEPDTWTNDGKRDD